LALILFFLVLAKRLAGISISDMTYLVSRETLNFNSNSLRLHPFSSPLSGPYQCEQDQKAGL